MSSEPVYLSRPGMINALGNDPGTILQHASAGDKILNQRSELIPGESVISGIVDSPLPSIPESLNHQRSRNNQLALAAALQIESEILAVIEQYGRHRVAVITGTSTAGIASTEDDFAHFNKTAEHLPVYHYTQHELGSSAAFLRDYFSLTGIHYAVSTACTSSAKALLSAAHLIKSGLCDAAIAGGVDSLCATTMNGFNALGLIAKDLANPFSKNRNGLNIGEGAAFFVLSNKKTDIAILGGGENSDAFHISAPDPEARGARACMSAALDEAGLSANDIDYLNLHGTGTALNDSAEAKAVHHVFGDQLACSSSKPFTGHCLGAAGAIEAALCALLLQGTDNKQSPPPHQWDGMQDPSLPYLHLLESGTQIKINVCMSNSFAFGGNNVSLILGRT